MGALETKGAIGGAVRTRCDERTAAECRQPRVWRGPGQLPEFDGLLGFNGDRVVDRGQVNKDMAIARSANRKRGSERHHGVTLVGELCKPHGHLDISGVEDAGGVELPKQALTTASEARVE